MGLISKVLSDKSTIDGIFTSTRKGKRVYMTVENMINGVNNPIGRFFDSRKEANDYINSKR